MGCVASGNGNSRCLRCNSTPSPRAITDELVRRSLLIPLNLQPAFNIFNCNLHKGADTKDNMRAFFSACKDTSDLVVATACFPTWKEGGRTNGCGKVIPAIRASRDRTRVFFFDDNTNLKRGGGSDCVGITNLRDMATGEFVDFSEGTNGFEQESAFDQTIIHHSPHYRNVIVQASVLDAIANPDYFTSIISRYSQEGDQIILYSDVNATIVMEDTIEGKGVTGVLLSTMLTFMELSPSCDCELAHGSWSPLKLPQGKPINLKQVVYKATKDDKALLRDFYNVESVKVFLAELLRLGPVLWMPNSTRLTEESFWKKYDYYYLMLQKHPTVDNIAMSWIQCFDFLKARGHKAVLASFGVDTLRVVINTVPNKREVVQLTVNYELWGERDVKDYNAMFKSERRPSLPKVLQA